MGDGGPSYFSHSPEWVGGILVTAQGPIPFFRHGASNSANQLCVAALSLITLVVRGERTAEERIRSSLNAY